MQKSVTVGLAALGVVFMILGLFNIGQTDPYFFLGIVCFVLVGLLPLAVWRKESEPAPLAAAK